MLRFRNEYSGPKDEDKDENDPVIRTKGDVEEKR